MRSYYDLLGVARDATADDLRRAFRRAALRLHPDRETGAHDEMLRLNQAYDTLKDAGRRAAYDLTLRSLAHPQPWSPRPASPPAASGSDPLDFKLRVFHPLDAAIAAAMVALDAAVEELAYDVYDDHHIARFGAAVEAAEHALTEAHRRLFLAPWPAALSSALNLYRQALRQADDAVEDFRAFTQNFDSDLLVEGRDLLRWASRMLAEARMHLGAGS